MCEATSTVIEVDPETATVTVQGYVDLETVPMFRKCLTQASVRGSSQVTVDLTACAFFDSTGLGALADTATDSDIEVVVRGASPFIRRVIEVSGIDAIVRVL